jgi:hypothetical protein
LITDNPSSHSGAPVRTRLAEAEHPRVHQVPIQTGVLAQPARRLVATLPIFRRQALAGQTLLTTEINGPR